MADTKKRRLPRPIRVLWGGFNAGVVMGIIDGLMVIFFGLAQFDRTGEIIGFLVWDAAGLGFIGMLCTAMVFGGLGYPLRSHPRVLSILNLVLLLGISSILSFSNVGWSFKNTRGTPPSQTRNVVLLTLDTLRADSTGAGGHPFVRTPNLDQLARKGRHYLNAVCPVPMTTPSHASMLTSTIPAVHGATENRYRLDETNETLTRILRNNGYRTAAFVSCFPLDRRFGLNRDFMLYHDRFAVPGDLRQASWYLAFRNLTSGNLMERNCRWTNSLALPWIRRYTGDNVPFFLWIHYFDPHSPYTPPRHEQVYYYDRVTPRIDSYPDAASLENARRAVQFTDRSPEPGRPEELYLGEVSEMDRAVGDILRQLARSNVLDRTFIAALADHGESFGEQGFFYTHGEDIYEPALAIPLILYSGYPLVTPGLDARLACASDIASTILPALGFTPGAKMEGFDLLNDTRRRQTALVENFGLIMTSRATKQRGVRTTDKKMILHTEIDRQELFDLANDPGEQQNLADLYPDQSLELSTFIREGFSLSESKRRGSHEDLSPDTLEKLKALGYVVPEL
jgi:arylsulfatase A-like enzyme